MKIYEIYNERRQWQVSFAYIEDAKEYIVDNAPEREFWTIEKEDWLTVENLNNFFTDALLYSNWIEFSPTEESKAKDLLNGKILCAVDDMGQEFEVSLQDVIEGFEIAKNEEQNAYQNVLLGNYDSYDADAILQCIIYGEVIYG